MNRHRSIHFERIRILCEQARLDGDAELHQVCDAALAGDRGAMRRVKADLGLSDMPAVDYALQRDSGVR